MILLAAFSIALNLCTSWKNILPGEFNWRTYSVTKQMLSSSANITRNHSSAFERDIQVTVLSPVSYYDSGKQKFM